MRKFVRAAALTAAAALATGAVPAASYANQGNDNKNERGAQTEQRSTIVFVTEVPCASDEGLFKVTAKVNNTGRFTDDRGHFTETGTFSAAPVHFGGWEQHDDHQHPVAGPPRQAPSYSGRFTASGTMNNNPNASTDSYNFSLKGESSAGEQISAHGVFHEHTSNGEVRSHLDRWTCR